MDTEPSSAVNETPFILIFTDLDGTLLDHHTYGWEEAKPALALCKRLDIPIILVSSKTGAEIKVLQKNLGLSTPFISENGGGICCPDIGHHGLPSGAVPSGKGWRWSLGVSYDVLVNALGEIREELGWDLRGFSEMGPEEIVQRTGLDPEMSLLAAMREYDEPFIVLEPKELDIALLYDAAKKKDLNITTGGRFYHIHGRIDKGASVTKLISWYKGHQAHVVSIALGDSPNDFSMLKRVDQPVLIRSSRHFPGIEKDIPGLQITENMGPDGWNRAVLDILGQKLKGGISRHV